jgi:hypothetical protein
MSAGMCLLLPGQDSEITVYIAPLRLLGSDYELRNPFVSKLVVLTSEMNTKNFELFLLNHELMMRSVRANIVNNKLNKYLKSPHCEVDLRHATLQELYFGDRNGNDIKVEWLNESLRTAKFDFTIPLKLHEMDKNAAPRYTKENLKDYLNYVIMPHSVNQKGMEYSIILPKEPDPIILVIQIKLSVTGAKQNKREIELTSKKSIEVLTMDPVKKNDNEEEGEEEKDTDESVKSLVDKYTNLGWPKENIVVLFQTNRKRRSYRAAVRGNILFMSEESLKNFFGPTVWDLLQSCYCLNNIKLAVTTNDQTEN